MDAIKHHLYFYQLNNYELQRHLIFRDYLRENAEERAAYKNLKYKIVELTNHDRKEYKVIINLGSSSTINLPSDSQFSKLITKSMTLSDSSRERHTLGGLQLITEKAGIIPKVKLEELEFENVDVNINTSSQLRIGINFY